MYAYIHTYVVATLQRIKKPSKGEKLRGEDGDFSKCWAIFRDLTPNKHRLRVTPSGLITGTAQHTGMAGS